MRLQDHLPPGVRVPGMLVVSILALLIAAGFVLASFFTIFNATIEPSVKSEDADVVSSLLANNRVLDRSEERFRGRSIFYIPRAPRLPTPPAPPPPPPQERPPDEPTPPPRVPTVYAGPDVTGVLGNDVFFDNGERITAGETAAGVKVLLIRGPFDLRLGWSGGEFDVNLFGDLPEYFSSVPFADGDRANLFSSESSPPTMPRSSARESANRTESRQGRPDRDEIDERMRAAREQHARANSPAEIPPPLTDSALAEMSRPDAARAIGEINIALRGDVDDETKSRLESDRKRLETHLRTPSDRD